MQEELNAFNQNILNLKDLIKEGEVSPRQLIVELEVLRMRARNISDNRFNEGYKEGYLEAENRNRGNINE